MTITAHEAPDAIATKLGELTDEALCLAWMGTEGKPGTQELALVRGWIMDELNSRLGDDAFDAWLMAGDENGEGLNPLAFFPSA